MNNESRIKELLTKICERSIGIISYVFPFFEISQYFAKKVVFNTENLAVQTFYMRHINPSIEIYQRNPYFAFALMVGIFFICSRGYIALTKYVRFNVIQAILLSIVCSCTGQILEIYIPVFIRESTIGLAIKNFVFLGVLILIGYSSILIAYGRYPIIPIISEAARIQVQRSA